MLDRLEEGTARQELFAASASHELRSPLSAIRTDLEVGLAYPAQADWKRIAGDTLIEIDRLDQLSRDLRSLIQMRATSTAAERFDLAELVAAETGRSRDGKAVHFEHGPGSTCIRADRESVLRLVRNLLDNARRHATSSVVASVRGDATWVTFEIANDGDPIPDTEREHIFEPFTRLDAARELDSEGSGLGLAIARAAAEANDGTLVALPTDDGATFEARFPPA
jgi:signal transduction histidine kinase